MDFGTHPPTKSAHDDGEMLGRAFDSVVSNGVIVSGGLISHELLCWRLTVPLLPYADSC